MSHSRNFETAQLLAVAAVVAGVDQWSKWLLLKHMTLVTACEPFCANSKVLVPGWLSVTPVANFHGAFGFFGDNMVLLIGMALLVLLLFWFSFREQAHASRVVRVAFGMILGGAIGNIVDRLRFHYVVDFIDFNRFPHIWFYTFNVADACITAGVILLILSSLATRRHA